MKKILIVSYHFPPDASVGSARPAKFAKYLPQFGWNPIILTVQERYHSSFDESRLRDVGPALRIYRTRMLPQVGRVYVDLKARFQKRLVGTGRATNCQPILNKGTVLSGLRRLFFSLEALPDDKQVWIPAAIAAGLKIIVREKVDVVFTSGPPMSCHVIGLLLKTVTGRRWIADFRDPWLLHRDNHLVPSTGLSRAIEAWLEKRTMGKADQVVLTTERMRADLHRRYPDITSKTTVIPNGYDPPDFESASQFRPNHKRFTLTHAGTIYYRRTAGPFLVCLADLINSGQIARTRVRVNFVGHSPGIRDRCRELRIDDVVTVVDAMSYRSCIEYLGRSDVLLLFAQGQPLSIPTKFYDYLAAKKPILVVTEDGATADLARQLSGPIVVRPDDRKGLEAHLKEMYEQFERSALSVREWNDEGIRSEFTRLELTKKLLSVIN